MLDDHFPYRDRRIVNRCFLLLFLALSFLSLSLLPANGSPSTPDTMNSARYSRSEPVALYNRALDLFYSNKFKKARVRFLQVLNFARNPQLIENASYMNARCLYELGEYIYAYRAFQRFKRNYPDTDFRQSVLELQLDIGFQLMNGKDHRSFLGLHILSAGQSGENIVRTLLERHPFEPFSDAYQYRLANYYFSRKQYESAAEEYKFLIDQYQESSWRPSARIMAGIAFLRSIESISYTTENLSKAEKHFNLYLKNFPKGTFVEQARKYLQKIDQMRAEKDFRTAKWYHRTGRVKGAIYYYKEVIRLHPSTTWAKRAMTNLREYDDPDAPLSDSLKEKYRSARQKKSTKQTEN